MRCVGSLTDVMLLTTVGGFEWCTLQFPKYVIWVFLVYNSYVTLCVNFVCFQHDIKL